MPCMALKPMQQRFVYNKHYQRCFNQSASMMDLRIYQLFAAKRHNVSFTYDNGGNGDDAGVASKSCGQSSEMALQINDDGNECQNFKTTFHIFYFIFCFVLIFLQQQYLKYSYPTVQLQRLMLLVGI